MGAAIQLGRLGISNYVIVERADDLGGTWYLNHYPGLAVDIESVTYSFSFEPNPNWSRRYAPGAELRQYANHVADKYELRSHMRFKHDVEQVAWDDASRTWTVSIKGQPAMTARFLFLATGYLSRPQRPNIPGIDDFQGKVIHTADWDDSYDLNGKRVAAIGTGATAVQLLPTIAPQLAHLDVFQRTAIWCAPKPDMPIGKPVQKMFASMPFTQRAMRMVSDTRLEFMTNVALFKHQTLPWMTKVAEKACIANIARGVKDKALRKKLIPNYPFGCKRPTFSNNYYPMFARDNVSLITDSIDHIERAAIVTTDGTRREMDTLILATGFKVWERDTFHSILGRNGVELRDHWKRTRFESYQGITIPGFPNLFYLPSPYSYTGLSYFYTLEGQMLHMDRLLSAMREQSATKFEVTAEATDGYLTRMHKRFGPSVFMLANCGGANSYYFDPHGAPSLIRPMPVSQADKEQSSFPLSDYVLS